MAQYQARVLWERGSDEVFIDNRYSRGHAWHFDGGVVLRASSSPHVVPRFSDPEGVDPEEAFVAALSSCHMLTFLHLAALAGHVVDRYDDTATGRMAKTEGRVWVSQVILRPQILWAAGAPPDAMDLHHRAHEECFIANSVRTEVLCQPI